MRLLISCDAKMLYNDPRLCFTIQHFDLKLFVALLFWHLTGSPLHMVQEVKQ